MNRHTLALAAALGVATAAPSLAHVTLEVPQAKVGSTYKAVLRVPHGCAGSATLKVRVQVPEGMFSVKPMPKAGWTMETVKGAYAKEYDNHGTAMKEGVKEIVWTGRLLDEHYDEFVFRGQLWDGLKPDTMLYIPVVQECETGSERWIEIPAAGKKADDYKTPAPGMKLLPAN